MQMKLLFGTTNAGKLNSMRRMIAHLDIEIINLNDIPFELPSIDESGKNPLENAKIKAKEYYKATKLPVFSCDSGLFFEGLPQDLQYLQPGVHVRNINGKKLNDDEMINYYGSIAKKMGGKITAQYKNAICLVLNENEIYEHMDDDIAGEKFIITEYPHEKRVEGFPIDSLSVHIKTEKYYFDLESDEKKDSEIEIDNGFSNFFTKSLKL